MKVGNLGAKPIFCIIILYHADENRQGGATVSKYFHVRDFELNDNMLQFTHQQPDGKLEMILTNLNFKIIVDVPAEVDAQLTTANVVGN